MEEKKKARKRRPSDIVFTCAIILLAAVFVISAGYLGVYYWQSYQSKQTYSQLQNLRGDYTRPSYVPPASGDPAPTAPAVELVTVENPKTGEKVQVLPQFAELYPLNPDLVGWITIEGTDVDYPVVQSPDRVDYYLRRDFYGKSDSHGCIYAREACDLAKPSDNVTLYGHRMKDGSMFAQLAKYEDKAFWQDHRYVYFDTLTEYHTYEIIYVLTTTASRGQGFEYHKLVDAKDAEEFNGFLVSCSQNALYDTGLSAVYGDKLICLSTCEYSQTNGRLVVVAKRVE